MNKNLIYTRIEDLLNEVGTTIDSENDPRKCLSLRILNDRTKLNRVLSLLDDQIPMRAGGLPSDFFSRITRVSTITISLELTHSEYVPRIHITYSSHNDEIYADEAHEYLGRLIDMEEFESMFLGKSNPILNIY